jgi:tRNA threonylcarbamoyladenosine biosynthesis protein TsaB
MTSLPADKLLIIETSGKAGSVALACQGQIVAERQLEQSRRHARDLAPAVHDLLHQQAWRPTDIDAVLVSRGPGSYTGLRVGIMSAKAFAYATGCRILGIDTFAALALQASAFRKGDPWAVEVIADAQQSRVYHQRYHWPTDAPIPIAATNLAVSPVADWVGQLSAGTCVTGPGVQLHVERLVDAVLVPKEEWQPRPASLLLLGMQRLQRGEKDHVLALEPLYLRRSSAEEQWEALGRK